MRLPEQRLWDRFRNNALGRRVKLNRIENAVGVGDPDVEVITRGRVSKVELKAVEAPPKRASTPLLGRKGLSTEQENWLIDWVKHGGRAFVMIGVGHGQHLIDCLDVAPQNINALTESQVIKAARAHTWDQIFYELGAPPL